MKIIIVDAQNDFLKPEGSLCIGKEAGAQLVQRLNPFIRQALTRGILPKRAGGIVHSGVLEVFCTLDTHKEDDHEFKLYKRHCIKFTHGWLPSIAIDISCNSKLRWLEKSGYALPNSDVDYICRDKDAYIIAGVCTHICVREIAAQIFHTHREKHKEFPKIHVFSDLLGDFDKELERTTLEEMRQKYGVFDLGESIDRIEKVPSTSFYEQGVSKFVSRMEALWEKEN